MARPWRLGAGGAAGVVLRQRLEQSPGLLQIRGVEPFGEPAVDGRQQRPRFGLLALLLPEATEAHGGAQLQRLRLLSTSHVEGLMKTGVYGSDRTPEAGAGIADDTAGDPRTPPTGAGPP